MGKPFDFPIHKLCKQILSKVTALPDSIAAVATAVADVAKYVVTNNTASKTGILSQKLSYLITMNEAHGSVERTTAGSQNWTCPAGVYQVLVIACGGQGGGGGGGCGYYGSSSNNYYRNATGGGSGGLSEIVYALIPVTPGTVYALAVGAGGTAGTGSPVGATSGSPAGSGGNGGDTKFGTLLTVLGGGGGSGGINGAGSSNALSIASGGSARVNNASTFRQMLCYLIGAAAGSKGVDTIEGSGTSNKGNHQSSGTAGGAAKTNRFGLKSGAGGAGGKNGFAGTASDSANDGKAGSNGGAGSPGYIKVIW